MREIAIMTAALVALSSSLDTRGAVGTEAKRPGAFDTPVVSSADFAGIVEERLEMAKVKALDSLSERVAQHAKVQSGSFLLQSDFQHNAEVKVVYRIPVDARGKPTKDAHHVVFRAFFPGEMNRYETKVIDGQKTRLESANLERKLEYYSDRLGFTAFSMYIECPRTLWGDPVECYFHGHQKWVDLVLRAQDELIEKFNLRNKRLFLVGHSLGGTFIQRIAAARPDRVAAVSALSAPDVVVPSMRSDTAWFLGITRGDSMAREYEELYQKLVEQGGNVVLNIFPPDYGERGNRGFYHSISNLADSACREFLRSVAEKLTSREEVQAQRWPFVRDRRAPLRILRAGHQDAAAIPKNDREHLPSESFVRILQSVPAPVHFVDLDDQTGRRTRLLAAIPAIGQARGVLIYCQEMDFRSLADIFDNIYFLAEQGYIVLAPRLYNARGHEIEQAVAYVQSQRAFAQLPLVFLGNGTAAKDMWATVASNSRVKPKAFAVVDFDPEGILDEQKLPPGGGIRSPLLFVYDEAPLVNVSSSDEAQSSLRKIAAVKEFVKTCHSQNQLARVKFVPKELDSAGKVSQQSVQAAATFLTKVVENRVSEIAP